MYKINSSSSRLQGRRLDANNYATKKTIAQGMLVRLTILKKYDEKIDYWMYTVYTKKDIALLTANASQLKYVLQLGTRHEFYYIMIALISTSIVLQVK